MTKVLTFSRNNQNLMCRQMSFCFFFVLKFDNFVINSMVVVAMAGRVELFRCVRLQFQVMGILTSKFQRTVAINWRNSCIFTSNLTMLILQLAFLFLRANTIQEYGMSIYGAVTLIVFSTTFLILVSKMSYILELIGNLEKFIELSKFHSWNTILQQQQKITFELLLTNRNVKQCWISDQVHWMERKNWTHV